MPAFKKGKRPSSSKELAGPAPTSEPFTGPVNSLSQAAEGVKDQDARPTEPGSDKGSHDANSSETVPLPSNGDNSVKPRQSWYGGTWPRTPAKAAPVTQLARDSISGGREVISRAAQSVKSSTGSVKSMSRPPSVYMSPGASTRSLPITGATSKVSVSTPKLGHAETHEGSKDSPTDQDQRADTKPSGDIAGKSHEWEAQAATTGTTTLNADSVGDGAWGISSWIPGFRRDQQGTKQAPTTITEPEAAINPLPSGPSPVPTSTVDTKIDEPRSVEEKSKRTQAPENLDTDSKSGRPASWFGLWNGESATKSAMTSQVQGENAKPTVDVDLAIRAAAPRKTEELDAGEPEQTPEARAAATSAALDAARPLGSSDDNSGRWSWWAKTPASKNSAGDNDQGKSMKDATTADGPSDGDTKMTGTENPKSPTSSRKRERPTSSDTPAAPRHDKIIKQSPDGTTAATAAVNVVPDDSSAKGKEKPVRRQVDSTNLLLPSLKQTFRAAETPGLLERLATYFFSSKAEMTRHAHLAKEPLKIKHAIAIGVHGYFPAPFIRSMIGQPRGTSVKFANMAADSIREWSQRHGCSPKIDKVVLEGEGKIEERVDLLWKLLINYIELIREADFILVACHSQGVPVAVQLVAKLIKFGVLGGKKIGICAMAGVNLGPFPEYKSRWIGGSAGELFDFASRDSQVSTDHEGALAQVLKAGIKVVLIGSIDDQLVSMESATFGIADHPGLFRAVFINGQVHAPTFLVHLVGFALKLRNLGVPDHGLIRELSSSLAGSFTGDGHSRLYEDTSLYDLAIEFALETTTCTDVPLNVRKGPGIAFSTSSQNPYILPFAMRGVLEEQAVKSELHDEMEELLGQFDEWKPTTKQLQNVKFRLEGVRSKM